jgi:hypothetical protein
MNTRFKHLALWAIGSFLCASPAIQAEDLNLKETPETTSVALNPFSYGATVGGLFAVNKELRDSQAGFLNLGLNADIRFADQFSLGLEYGWLIPGSSQGGGITFDYLLGKGALRPFVGLGGGLTYMDEGKPFGNSFGANGSARIGLLFDVLDQLQLRVAVPFVLIANDNPDQLAGVNFTLLFSGPHRHTQVKKLTY